MEIGKDSNGQKVVIDLKNLIATRLLIQANSGGGKSWLLRRLLEQSHGKVQQIVLDLEGEFSTLREHYDYLLVGKDGEVPANIKTAALLARKLLELNVSTIIDLSELKKHERILFVKRFLESLVSSPKNLWHPCLIIVDEAHEFCPQASKSESASAVIDLMTRGRKRGFCGVLATQRISKLHKDACAEANNRLIGRTGIDIDRKRAAEELGFTSKEDERSLRNLKPGEIYAFGPSISTEVIKVKVGAVKSTHPEPGMSLQKVSKTPDNIKKLLKNVIDLPKEAEDEIRTLNEHKTEIIRLKRELGSRPVSTEIKEVFKIDEVALQKSKEQGFKEAERFYKSYITPVEQNTKRLRIDILKLVKNAQTLLESKAFSIVGDIPTPVLKPIEVKQVDPTKPLPRHILNQPSSPVYNAEITADRELGKCARTVYSYLFENPTKQFTKVQLGLISGYSPKSGGFNNAIYSLAAQGLLVRAGKLIGIGEVNPDMATENAQKLSIDAWLNKLPKCSRELFRYLLDNPHQDYSKEELADATNYSSTSGGFNNAIYKLTGLEMIKREGSRIKLNPEIMELA